MGEGLLGLEVIEPSADGDIHLGTIGTIFDDHVAFVIAGSGPPGIAFVVQGWEDRFLGGVFGEGVDSLRVFFGSKGALSIRGVILVDARFVVGAISADISAPSGEAVMGAGHEVDEGAAGPGKRRGLQDLEIMFIHVSANAFIAILISGNGNVLLGRFIRFTDGTKFGINEQSALSRRRLLDKVRANRAIIGLFVVLLDEEFDIGKGIFSGSMGEFQVFRFLFQSIGDRLNAALFRGIANRLCGGLENVRIFLVGEHDQEVTTNRFRGRSHEHRSFVFADEIPAVREGLGLIKVIEFKDFVQGLESKRLFVIGIAFPFLRDIVQEITRLNFFGIDLVGVLD